MMTLSRAIRGVLAPIRLVLPQNWPAAIAAAIGRVLPRNWVGRIRFYWRGHEVSSGPFNGQTGRVEIFKAILDECHPIAIVETGTHLGSTTYFLAHSTTKPVYTVECDAESYGFASERLRGCKNAFLEQGDSRSFLSKCVRKPNLQNGPVLFYLDAHWNEDLPLAEEIEIVFSALSESIVMVDDFQVPNEIGYGYDDYGAGQALTSKYIALSCQKFNLVRFFPAISAHEETGAKRGCVVLAGSGKTVSKLERINLLRCFYSP